MAQIIPMLALSPTMQEATIVKWRKAEGDLVAAGDVLCEVETDKAVMEYEAADGGTLLKILRAEGQSCAVGDPIAVMGQPGEDVSELPTPAARGAEPHLTAEPPAKPVAPMAAPAPTRAKAPLPKETPKPRPPVQAPPSGRVKASPLARRLAREAGVDIASVVPSGPGGRVVKRDIDRAE